MKTDRMGDCCMRITLDRPDARNALDRAAAAELTAAVTAAENTPWCRIILLTAAGPFFCSGMDLGETLSPDWAHQSAPVLREALMALARSPLTTVAVVNGAATGGGVGLAAACDLVIAGPHATFRLTETLLGLVPATILPVIARRTGGHRAHVLALTAQELNADAATELGLADHSATDVESAVRSMLRRLRAADAEALRALKQHYTDLYPPDWVAAKASTALVSSCLSGAAARLAAYEKAGLLP